MGVCGVETGLFRAVGVAWIAGTSQFRAIFRHAAATQNTTENHSNCALNWRKVLDRWQLNVISADGVIFAN
jgi:hypothetical protein